MNKITNISGTTEIEKNTGNNNVNCNILKDKVTLGYCGENIPSKVYNLKDVRSIINNPDNGDKLYDKLLEKSKFDLIYRSNSKEVMFYKKIYNNDKELFKKGKIEKNELELSKKNYYEKKKENNYLGNSLERLYLEINDIFDSTELSEFNKIHERIKQIDKKALKDISSDQDLQEAVTVYEDTLIQFENLMTPENQVHKASIDVETAFQKAVKEAYKRFIIL